MAKPSPETKRRRPPFIAEPLVVVGLAGVCGSLAPGALPATALVVAAAAGLGWAALPQRPLGRYLLVLAVLLEFGLVRWRAQVGLEAFEQARVWARDTLGHAQRCAALVRVTSSPTVRTQAATSAPAPAALESCTAEPAAPPPEGERKTSWTGTTELLECETGQLAGAWTVRISGGPEDLARGDQVNIVAGLAPVQLFRNAGLADPTAGAARRRAVVSGGAWVVERATAGMSLASWIDRERAHVRARIEASYPQPVIALGRALVLGENDLPDEDAAAFSRSGLMHLLAVSGTHLVIAVLALVEALRAALVRVGFWAKRYDVARVSSALGALFSLLYADFAGGSGSAWRAAYMLCFALGARALGYRAGGAAALGASLIAGTALDPLAGSDLSFLLSALATAGLIGLGQPLSVWVARGPFEHGLLNKLALSLVATLSSSVACAPALALLDGQMTLAALVANVVAGPLGEVLALPACLLHGVSSWFAPLERGLALLGGGALYGVRAVALWSASVRAAQFQVPLPAPFDITVLALSALSLAFHCLPQQVTRPSRASLFTFTCTLALFVLARLHAGSPAPAQLTVTALDVGQGDGMALELPDGQLGFVDGGGFPTGVPDTGERVLVPFARSRGRHEVALMILSHAHPDHLLGLVSAARQLTIRELWHPRGASAELGPYKELLELVKQQGGRILGPRELCGTGQIRGGATFRVLAPCPVATELGANDESLVVRLSFGSRSLLLTGDVEHAGEARLVAGEPGQLHADVLKIPHHGSHTSSSPELLAAVAPRWAFVSSGVRNRFDHPRQDTLDRLRAARIGILRTDRAGSLSYRTDGRSSEIWAFSEPR